MTIFYKVSIASALLLAIQIPLKGQAAKWKVEKGQIQITEPSNKPALDTWNYVYDLLPTELIDKYVTSFTLETDGKDGELGGLTPLDDYNSMWELSIDQADFTINEKDQVNYINTIHTIIHEFGHLLTLNPEQIDFTEDEYQNDQKGYLTAEGYASDKSYLGQFVNQFWDLSLLNEWDKIDVLENENKREKRLERFYNRHFESFISAYASESPEEDIAESWTFFVLTEQPIEDEFGVEKIAFFYQFEELKELRKMIRAKVKNIPRAYIKYYIENQEDY